MCKPGSVNGRHVALQIQTREPIKSIRTASNFTKQPRLEMTKEDIAHIKTCKATNECYSTYSLSFLQELFGCKLRFNN